jgi:hypothetical protein
MSRQLLPVRFSCRLPSWPSCDNLRMPEDERGGAECLCNWGPVPVLPFSREYSESRPEFALGPSPALREGALWRPVNAEELLAPEVRHSCEVRATESSSVVRISTSLYRYGEKGL